MGEQGFRIIGVTNETGPEGREKTAQWVADKGVNYGYAFDIDKKLTTALGLRGYPSAYLVDPSGIVVWSGHPASLSEGKIKKFMKDALATPMWEWPDSLEGVRDDLRAGNLGAAFAAAEAIDGEPLGKQIAELVDQRVTAQVEGIDSMLDRLDALGAKQMLDNAESAWEGMKQADKLPKLMKTLESKKVQAALEAQQRMLSIGELLNTATEDELEDLIKEVEKIGKSYKKKAPADEAENLVAKLERKLKSKQG